ncbi:S8 family serine peptidase [Mucilaginibacter sp. BJC16-A38]|uniref:S8 family serine peptidase n=1 Tax=Mucilaginibacter phenanthrenivorans TaxID=1234842 RepID=UPI002157C95B|nr:S8 family serine peptidase [Mucilaginibacter phenanthrenivorans]MCR8556959.1 S8 family serine peptidase [Mucilaginibacter phenanthrenivorans]
MNINYRTLLAIGVLTAGLSVTVLAQRIPNWQNKDLQRDSLFGISTEKAYTLLKGKKAVPVIVAVIDAGVDTLHEDLKEVLWVNPRKKKGDDGTFGWSYLGSAKGNVHYDNLELTRQVRQFIQKDTGRLNTGDLTAFHEETKALDQKKRDADKGLKYYTNYLQALNFFAEQVHSSAPTVSDLEAYLPKAGRNADYVQFVISGMKKKNDYNDLKKDVQEGIDHFKEQENYQLNTAYDPRVIVGDDYFNSKQRNYGSPDVMGPDPTHGTHVAGIIAGIRGNGLGADGIADHVKILAIRTVPDGDERDKDVANAIRYAADHGAKVINMSFGKAYSQDKKAVDEAVKYALKKDVLLVQAAGNNNENIDSVANFPNRQYLHGEDAGAYIVVGASGLHPDSTLKASFSNYGKTAVDVFAPGVQIYSSIPGSKYAYFDGTSMACPVVAGLAALIREYYPKLSAVQVKEIILRSVVKSDFLAKYCLTGGVVNVYNALQLAADY